MKVYLLRCLIEANLTIKQTWTYELSLSEMVPVRPSVLFSNNQVVYVPSYH